MMESELLKQLLEGVVEGRRDDVRALTRKALESGVEADQIVNEAITPAMEIVGKKFQDGEWFLPDMLTASFSAQAAFELLRPHLAQTGAQEGARKTVVIGTIEGDIHDIGKNIVAAALEGGGFNVVDLGVSVSGERFARTATATKADIVAVSALLTTTMRSMEKVVEALEGAGVRQRVKVLLGGAPLTEGFVKKIGADAYGKDAMDAVARARELVTAGEQA